MRINRLKGGNFRDCRSLREGVWEMRIDHGRGYCVYYTMEGREVVILRCAGDKRKQAADIERAREYLKDHRRRTKAQ